MKYQVSLAVKDIEVSKILQELFEQEIGLSKM